MPAGRFAPSPTGDLHLGNLRTALLAWWWSRRTGDAFVVRMEDLDRVTSSREHERSQLADLAAIGIDWDGEVVRQSERFDRYHDALQRLVDGDLVYPCYCTRREIAEAASAPNAPVGRYPGTCRELSTARRNELEAAGRPPALRLRAGGSTESFHDLVLGDVTGTADDIVLRRNDGVPAYHLAVVVDDDAQGIGIVVRGDDLAESALGQLHLQRALGIDAPAYAHVPLVLGPDGRRLAKRDGSVTLADRARLGDAPDQVAAWLAATAGQSPDTLRDPTAFDPTILPREPLVMTEADLSRSLRSPG